VSNLQLFTACVAIWGSTWLAITYQLGAVEPEASVTYRFLLASLLLFAYCRIRKLPLRYPAREHLWIALFGVLMFGASYICVYYAEQRIVSGLVAVGYSASPLLAMLGQRAFFGTPMTGKMAVGSVLGIVGITLVFWPAIAHFKAGESAAAGATFTVLAVLISTLGNMVAHRNHDAKIPVWQGMAWGMLYGAAFSALWTLAIGKGFAFLATPAYVLSLLYLVVFGSVLAFAAFLTLLGRIGAARSGYIGVMVPIVALVISALFEGFRWHALTWAGIAVSVAGNVIILRRA
jgi:drug/metabolite transporter (DMT)-like permease